MRFMLRLEKQGAAAHNYHAVQLVFALHESGQDANEIATNRAADATIVHLKNLFFGVEFLLDKRVIDTDLAELRVQESNAKA